VFGIFLLSHFGIFDIISGTPFSLFKYPLDVDLQEVVQAIRNSTAIDIKPINEYAFSRVIENNRICHDGVSNDILVLLLIKSSVEHFENRMAIRQTWGGKTRVNGQEIRKIFLLGVRRSHDNLQDKVIAENDKYGDLIQDNFHDAYFNNTLKAMMGFKWSVTNCKNAKFIFGVDDDYFVSTKNLVEYLLSIGDRRRFLVGYVFKISLPKRNPYNKWYISRKEYPFFFYPEYPTAGSFIVSTDLAQEFDIAFRYTKYLRFDDVFLGIVALKLGVKPLYHQEFYFTKVNPLTNRHVIASHGYSEAGELRQVWQQAR
jgi:hypothetical protein